jgi:photoactive yellow protein
MAGCLGAMMKTELSFAGATIQELDAAPNSFINTLPFGVIGLSPDGLVEVYNETESRHAGLPAEKVIGHHFFHSVAPCMNNFMVAQRFEDEGEIDDIVNYVLTFRMRPTSVQLRLLKHPTERRRYLLISPYSSR